MKRLSTKQVMILVGICIACVPITAQVKVMAPFNLQQQFQSPPPAAAPWVIWYWNQASVSRQGITADLEAMKENGIGGAYLMFIKGAANPPLMEPPVEQLSPLWWQMVNHAMMEAKRLGLQIGLHVSDGFALAGGPWITPELSMQKMVWTTTNVTGGSVFNDILQQPETIENYYKDIAVFAYPSPEGAGISTRTVKPVITASKTDSVLALLIVPGNKRNFASNDSCWIQYEFQQPFTCRSILVSSITNYQSNRLVVQVSNDGKNFSFHTRLQPPRHGWQDWDAPYTHSIAPVTARFFRFVFDKKGSEPGSEDLDAAKWKPALKITGLELSAEGKINQYEGKNGEVWRISKPTTIEQIADRDCVPLQSIIDISHKLDEDGRLNWEMPPGKWTIIRIGHTSTGHRNATGGGGKGLECDKFNPEAIQLQFDNWFGTIFNKVGKNVADSVIKIFHIDSWECGSQNWSPVFREAFKLRRGYDLFNYLPAIAGVPIQSTDVSERFLNDVRATIAELVNENFYNTLAKLAHEKGCSFVAESVAPTMVSDGMLHYSQVDVPMGEFWLRSPTHDKPNDMLDAISAAHIYGKPIVQAEAFTELRLTWDEHPGMLKTLQDRNYSMGINRFVYHVFMQNPWMDRKPGMSLDGIGLFFQRDQTWWKQGRAWVDYAKRCQALLQIGNPVADLAVFTGEELPRRSILPEYLINTLPGIFGKERVTQEAIRLANIDEPMVQSPPGVNHSANMVEPEDWVDPLNGYAYDSYNKDALLRLTTVTNNKLSLEGGARYQLLVLPGNQKMNPAANRMSLAVASQIEKLVIQGATLLVNEKPTQNPGLNNSKEADINLQQVIGRLWNNKNNKGENRNSGSMDSWKLGKGMVIQGPYTDVSFKRIGLLPDFIATDKAGNKAPSFAWTHRTAPGLDIYFISNQLDTARMVNVSLRVNGRLPELWDAVTDKIRDAKTWKVENGRTQLPLFLQPNESIFIVLQKPVKIQSSKAGKNWIETRQLQKINGGWSVSFDTSFGGYSKPVVFDSLQDWSKHTDTVIRYYSGTAAYENSFVWNNPPGKNKAVWINVGKVANIASVIVNGMDCGIIWTAPYRADISKAIRSGKNELKIVVTNTWANRITGDQRLPEAKRITKTNAPYRIEGKPLLEAGLIGPVVLEVSDN